MGDAGQARRQAARTVRAHGTTEQTLGTQGTPGARENTECLDSTKRPFPGTATGSAPATARQAHLGRGVRDTHGLCPRAPAQTHNVPTAHWEVGGPCSRQNRQKGRPHSHSLSLSWRRPSDGTQQTQLRPLGKGGKACLGQKEGSPPCTRGDTDTGWRE